MRSSGDTQQGSQEVNLELPFRYDGKRVVVSGGGGGGMGAAAVEQLSRLGAEIHVLDLREPPIEVASYRAVDLRDPAAMETAVDDIGGTIHALFNCAGVPGPPFFSDVDTMLVNFAAPHHLARIVAARMTEGGAICTISSAAGAGWLMHIDQWKPLIAAESFTEAAAWIEGHPEEIAGGYAPSKEAIIVWTLYAAMDYGERGIRLNCITPGTTQTPMADQFDQMPETAQYADLFTGALRRRSLPAEQGWPMVFLNSDAASFITGANLSTDGGAVGAMMTGRMVIDFG